MPLVSPLLSCERDGHSEVSGGIVARSIPKAASAALMASSSRLRQFPAPAFPAFAPVGVVGPVALNAQVASLHAQHLGPPASGEHQRQDDGTVPQAYRRVGNYCQELVHLVSRRGLWVGWVRLAAFGACRRGWTGRYPCG